MNDSYGYYQNTRSDLLDLIPNDAFNILDCGCGAGELDKKLKQRQDCHIHGIEKNRFACEKAGKILDAVTEGDMEKILKGEGLEFSSFDCIILADILEHLYQPWDILDKCSDLLRPSGCLILSVPNVSHFSVVWPLLMKHQWHYANHGILDRSHIRFFTLPEITKALNESGYTIETVKFNQYSVTSYSWKLRLFALSLYALPKSKRTQFLAIQWLIKCKPVPE